MYENATTISIDCVGTFACLDTYEGSPSGLVVVYFLSELQEPLKDSLKLPLLP